MARHKLAKPSKIRPGLDLNQQGANALLAATFDFLRRNNISKKSILEFTQKHLVRNQRDRSLRVYRELEQAQEDMGLIMGTWFSHPKFLDASGRPRSRTAGKGANSIAHLVRVSRARIQGAVAIQLMRQSPSIKFTSDGQLIALKRVFLVPKLEIPRAAFVVERYLETVLQIASDRKKDAPLLLERSCHVSEVDLAVRPDLTGTAYFVRANLAIRPDLAIRTNLTVGTDLAIRTDLTGDAYLVRANLAIRPDLAIRTNLTVGTDLAVRTDLTGDAYLVRANLAVRSDLAIRTDLAVGTNLTVRADLAVCPDLTVSANLTVGTKLAVGDDLDARLGQSLSVVGIQTGNASERQARERHELSDSQFIAR